jgi:hypothetical protein
VWARGLAALLLLSAAAFADDRIDWASHGEADTVTVITTDEDGSTRETTVWLVVLDGDGYIATGSTRWGANIERNRDVVLRIGETELALRAEFVTEPEARTRIEAEFREKYPSGHWLWSSIRLEEVKIMRLLARPTE